MKKILVFLLSVCCVTVFAQNIPAKLKTLHKANEKVEASFTEARVNPKVKKTENRAGTLVYQAPDDLRMDYTTPAGDYVLINKDKIEVSKKGKVQTAKVKNKENRYVTYRATLLCCLAGDVENAAELNNAKAVCAQQGNTYVCTITAEKAANKEMKEIQLVYDATTGAVLSMTLTEGSGNYSTFTVK